MMQARLRCPAIVCAKNPRFVVALGGRLTDHSSVESKRPPTTPTTKTAMKNTIATFTVQPEELPRIARNLRARLEGKGFYNYSVNTSDEQQGTIEITAFATDYTKADALEQAMLILATSL